MIQLKRIIALSAALAMLAMLLLGCGGQSLPPIEETTEPTTTTEEPTTITEAEIYTTEEYTTTTAAPTAAPTTAVQTAPNITTPAPVTQTTTTTAAATTPPQGPGGNPHTTPPANAPQGGPITNIRITGVDRSSQVGGAWVLQQTRSGPDVEPQRQVIWQITPATARVGEDFRVRSSNPSIAQAPWHGLLRGMAPGEVIITVYSIANPAIYDTIRVRVAAAE